MSNNTTIGSLSYGTYIANNTLTGTYGSNNFNSSAQGMYVAGNNTGTIVGGGLNSAKEGVYVDASTSNLSGVTFQNILANNNSSVGFRVSGNNLNYLTPVTLNINGLVANTNLDVGFEGYNITGNLSSVVANNNYVNGIKTSIGNGDTIFDGLTSTINTIVSSGSLIATGTTLSSASPYGLNVDGSLYFNGTSDGLNAPFTSNFDLINTPWSVECWIYPLSSAGGLESTILSIYREPATSDRMISIGLNRTTGILNVSNNVNFIFAPVAIPFSTWSHVLITGPSQAGGGAVSLYINGVFSVSGTNAGPRAVTPNQFNIGFNQNTSGNGRTNYFYGYMSNFRLIKGNQYFTSNFTTPSASPLTLLPYTTLLLKAPYYSSYTYLVYALATTPSIVLNILSGYNYGKIIIKNALLSATSTDPSLSATIGLTMNSTRFSKFSLDNSTISASTPIQLNITRNLLEGSYLINNSYLGSNPLGTGIVNKYQPYTSKSTGFAFTKFNKIAGYNVTYYAHGERAIDNSIANNVLEYPTERLTPYSKTIKIRSGSKFVALDAGDNTIVRVSVRKSISTGGETLYNGNPPRLMLKSNPSVGVYNDTVLDQLTLTNDVSGSFVQLTGSTQAIIYNGVLEFYIDCDGSQGWINIDNWEAS